MAKRKKAAVSKSRAKKRRSAPGKSGFAVARGPRKSRLKKKLGPISHNHKRRSAWFQARAAWPLREARTDSLVRERARVERELAPAAGVTQWESIGPSNIGGRMTSLVCHPTQPDIIWAGSAGGGVWHSTDAGRSWTPLWHLQSVLNVGSLAIHPANPKMLYCGTGEANLSADSYAGVGLYRTTNGGKTWTLFASSKRTGIPSRIGVIAVDPHDPSHIRIGGIGYGRVSPEESGSGGMYTSRDAGKTWTRETFISAQNYWCHSIVFNPTRPQTIFAAFTTQGSQNGIWRSTDGGSTWTHLTQGLPAPAEFDRTMLAIAPSNPAILYAQAANQHDGLLGIFRTSNGGDTWKDIAGGRISEGQMTYGNAIAVHPTDPDYVICGGVDLHLTTDGGTNWQQVSHWDSERGQTDYAHADHHALVMPPAASGRVYDANDGGMDTSVDGGHNWENRSVGLAATMYYDLDVAPSDPLSFGGGTQDNGTNITTTGASNDHQEILGGDGGWMVYHPARADQIFASYYNMHIFRFRGQEQPREISPPADNKERASVWMVFITLDPNKPSTVFTGSKRVWRSKDDGTTWQAVSDILDDSPISAIEVAPADSRRIFVGTENGGLFRSIDGGATWSANMAGPELPSVTITRLETSPQNADVIFATIANFGNSHVFRSDNGGANWHDVDGGRLPDVPHHAVAIPADEPQTVYVCSDAGVHVSRDLGASWSSLKRNLPNTMCVDLVYHQGAGTLTAATYGRSLWRLKVRAR